MLRSNLGDGLGGPALALARPRLASRRQSFPARRLMPEAKAALEGEVVYSGVRLRLKQRCIDVCIVVHTLSSAEASTRRVGRHAHDKRD